MIDHGRASCRNPRTRPVLRWILFSRNDALARITNSSLAVCRAHWLAWGYVLDQGDDPAYALGFDPSCGGWISFCAAPFSPPARFSQSRNPEHQTTLTAQWPVKHRGSPLVSQTRLCFRGCGGTLPWAANSEESWGVPWCCSVFFTLSALLRIFTGRFFMRHRRRFSYENVRGCLSP